MEEDNYEVGAEEETEVGFYGGGEGGEKGTGCEERDLGVQAEEEAEEGWVEVIHIGHLGEYEMIQLNKKLFEKLQPVCCELPTSVEEELGGCSPRSICCYDILSSSVGDGCWF